MANKLATQLAISWQKSRQLLWRALLAVLVIGVSPMALAASAGQPAPNFTVTDTQGKPVQLADFKGRYVVLEWTNPQCPFVRNHYNTKNMQTLQESWGPRGVVWLSIDSSNKSSWEYMAPAKLDAWMHERGATPKAVLVDSESAVGEALSGQDHAAHVRDRPGGQDRLCRGDRRPALDASG